jgi:hypothetical protein
MVFLRALIYACAVFVALGIISILVAGLMRILYSIIQRREKKPEAKKAEVNTIS